jgi:hypothetical protein
LKHIISLILFCFVGCTLSAQYIHYRQKPANNTTKDLSSGQQVQQKKADPPKAEPVKEEPPKPEEKVYKTYPDKCPGRAGAVPWCLSYVPDLTRKILIDRYNGYLMTIKGIVQEDRTILYHCQICSDGVMITEYAKEDGTKVIK